MHENEVLATAAPKRIPWNKGKLIGPGPPLRQKHVWANRSYSRPSTARSKVKTPSWLSGRLSTSGWRSVRSAS
jgi:hypothetical protein